MEDGTPLTAPRGPRLARPHPDDLELHCLPPYSPELNPDVLVNADLKPSLPSPMSF
ncbi:hypothetical protein ACWEN3_30570 [Streptomyces sp. NPDC004561]